VSDQPQNPVDENSDMTFERDGTSQIERKLDALSPDYVQIDERQMEDLIDFAKQYARELRYTSVNADGTDVDWEAFFQGMDPDELIATETIVNFVNDRSRFSSAEARLLKRPHFVLFLVFLQLLQHSQNQMNKLTKRHLDFYYQQYLQITKKLGVPDRVAVLVDLARDVNWGELDAGTALDAGADSLGQTLIYKTEDRLLANHAQITQVKSLFVDQDVIDIASVYRIYQDYKSQFVEMFKIALGDSQPGDDLPPFESHAITFDFLVNQLSPFLNFVNDSMHMSFYEFKKLMEYKTYRYSDDGLAEWGEINDLLEQIGKYHDPDFSQDAFDNIRDFEANLRLAIDDPDGKKLMFEGVTEVQNIYDLYNEPTSRDSVNAAIIGDPLHFGTIEDFQRMMQLKVTIDSHWIEINSLLEDAARRRLNDLNYSLFDDDATMLDLMDFEANLQRALPDLDFPTLPGLQPPIATIDAFYALLLDIEAHFYMLAGDLDYILDKGAFLQDFFPDADSGNATNQAANSPITSEQWERIFSLLREAYHEKIAAQYYAEFEGLEEEYGDALFDEVLKMVLLKIHGATIVDRATQLEILDTYLPQSSYDSLESLSDKEKLSSDDKAELYRIARYLLRSHAATLTPYEIKWRNIFPMDDATQLTVSLGVTSEEETPRWETFGRKLEETSKDEPPPNVYGWAISSPILMLSAGTRTIELTLEFAGEQFNKNDISDLLKNGENDWRFYPFIVEVTTEDGWITPQSVTIAVVDSHANGAPKQDPNETPKSLKFTLSFDESIAAITPPPEDTMFYGHAYPFLRVMMRQNWDGQGYMTEYPKFKDLNLLQVNIFVDVKGLEPEQMQNDQVNLKPGKPFEPFGGAPSTGSNFYFGHAELNLKTLASLTLNMEWMDLPNQPLETHYTNYTLHDAIAASGLRVEVGLSDRRKKIVLASQDPLVDHKAIKINDDITINSIAAAIAHNHGDAIKYERLLNSITDPNDLLKWNRYFQWQLLAPDFQHRNFPSDAAKQSRALAIAIANEPKNITDGLYDINPPYTPKIKQLLIDYTSSETIVMDEYQSGEQIDKIYHIQPFGYAEVLPDEDPQTIIYPFLAQYLYEGELYIGIQDLVPRQTLTILFQMAEGSANPDLEVIPIEWHYLSGNRWIRLNEQISSDGTRGFINSGIIVFDLLPAQPSTLLPPECYWIRASIPRNPDAVCDIVDIHTQAVMATFVDNNNALDHLSMPLPEQSIQDLLQPRPDIKGVRQPYTSFGGKMPETDDIFYTRVSERLRHKNRAITIWDYEHMILEQFPEIFKVKCLPASRQKPGQVEIIVIPNVSNKIPFNPFEPKAPTDVLEDIEQYIARYTPVHARVNVRNAHFVPFRLRFGVKFNQGYNNEAYYVRKLNDDINRFLAPWAYDSTADIVIGGRIYDNVIINFIDEREYVDFVAQVKLFLWDEESKQFSIVLGTDDGYWLKSDRNDAVLVPTQNHQIDLISDFGYEVSTNMGINYMVVELDFQIAGDD